jgi:hypothetical protein
MLLWLDENWRGGAVGEPAQEEWMEMKNRQRVTTNLISLHNVVIF